jgi:DNA-binding NarL/FixJ family response regulator
MNVPMALAAGDPAGAIPLPAGPRVAVAVGNVLARVGVRHLLSQCVPVPTVRDVPANGSLLAAVRSLRPDVLVLSIDRPAGPPAPVLAELGRLTHVIALCYGGHAAAEDLAARGKIARVLVHGRFTKNDFVRCVAALVRLTRPGPAAHGLSAREEDVMRCIARGMRNTDIAAELVLTPKTVKNHINRIFAKLGVETRTQALLVWLNAASSVA